MQIEPFAPEMLHRIDAWWRAANYLSVGPIYRFDNPLSRKPLALAHVKPRRLGHWGTTPTMQRHRAHIGAHGDDMPEVRDWRWSR